MIFFCCDFHIDGVLCLLCQDSNLQVEASKKEKEEILAKLAQAEKMAVEWKNRVHKLEEDNGKLRRALEQSMTRLSRMSVDSDFLVDRLESLQRFAMQHI